MHRLRKVLCNVQGSASRCRDGNDMHNDRHPVRGWTWWPTVCPICICAYAETNVYYLHTDTGKVASEKMKNVENKDHVACRLCTQTATVNYLQNWVFIFSEHGLSENRISSLIKTWKIICLHFVSILKKLLTGAWHDAMALVSAHLSIHQLCSQDLARCLAISPPSSLFPVRYGRAPNFSEWEAALHMTHLQNDGFLLALMHQEPHTHHLCILQRCLRELTGREPTVVDASGAPNSPSL